MKKPTNLLTLPGNDELRGINGQGVRTFEMVQTISGRLEGEFDDWPSHIQDAIFEAMERKAEEVGLPLAMAGSVCDYDSIGEKWFIRVILSEVVAKLEAKHLLH